VEVIESGKNQIRDQDREAHRSNENNISDAYRGRALIADEMF